MNPRRVAPAIGAVVCLVTAIVVVAPFAIVEGHDQLVGDYYAAGPVGLGGVVFFSLVGVVAFASADRGNVDPQTMAGVLVVLAAALVALAGLWWALLDDTVLYSFPQQYRWIEWHPQAVFVLSMVVLAAAGFYANVVMRGTGR